MRKTILLVAAMLLAFVLAVQPAAAVTTRIPVAGEIVRGRILVLGELRQSGDELKGTEEMRGTVARHWWEGDPYLEGEAVVTYNWSIAWSCDAPDVCTQTGRLWGTIASEPKAFDGGWRGSFSYLFTYEEVAYSGKLHANGYGELEGLQLTLYATYHTATGYVSIPGA